MEKTVFKYVLGRQRRSTVQMQEGAQLLSCQVQYGVACIWAAVYATAPLESRTFVAVPTGGEIPQESKGFVGTVQYDDGDVVQHIFEV